MSTRHTRSRRDLPKIARRTTMKKQKGGFIESVVLEQRGGAVMKVVASDGTPEGRIRGIFWRDVLETDEDLKFLLEEYGAVPTDEEKPLRLKNYLTIVSRQDDLFTYALEAIALHLSDIITKEKKKDADIKLGDYNSMKGYAAFINSKKDLMIPYLEDVERLVNFTVGTGVTKITQIKQEPLTTLLLFPWRVNNVFVQSIAKILTGLKQNDSILTAIRAEQDVGVVTRGQKQELHDLLASQWESFAMSQAYSLTAKELRDGFYLGQGIQEFKDDLQRETFWKSLAEKIGTIPAIPACKNLKEPTTWVDIVCGVYGLYKNGTLTPKSILELYSGCAIDNPADVAMLKDTELPNRDLWKIPITNSGVTLEKLLSLMDDSTLQLLLHLAYTIQTLENDLGQDVKGEVIQTVTGSTTQLRSLLGITQPASASVPTTTPETASA